MLVAARRGARGRRRRRHCWVALGKDPVRRRIHDRVDFNGRCTHLLAAHICAPAGLRMVCCQSQLEQGHPDQPMGQWSRMRLCKHGMQLKQLENPGRTLLLRKRRRKRLLALASVHGLLHNRHQNVGSSPRTVPLLCRPSCRRLRRRAQRLLPNHAARTQLRHSQGRQGRRPRLSRGPRRVLRRLHRRWLPGHVLQVIAHDQQEQIQDLGRRRAQHWMLRDRMCVFSPAQGPRRLTLVRLPQSAHNPDPIRCVPGRTHLPRHNPDLRIGARRSRVAAHSIRAADLNHAQGRPRNHRHGRRIRQRHLHRRLGREMRNLLPQRHNNDLQHRKPRL
eukprot:comp22418_c0_seq1/m.54703 comp22418_c0_seq1/g.54703  ORF comp22418_c0_seq1/g.54703 comp22418_c0_seq1/m.54703 type:complete len:333 (-) comp22418_c0_seq1:819-1817(-)